MLSQAGGTARPALDNLNELLAARKRVDDGWQAKSKPVEEFTSAGIADTNPDDLRSRTCARPSECKVLVLCHDHGSSRLSERPDNTIIGVGQTDISDVFCRVSLGTEPSCERRGQLCIDQEAHLPGAKHRMVALLRRVLQGCCDIGVFQVWIVSQDVGAADASSEKFQHVFHADA